MSGEFKGLKKQTQHIEEDNAQGRSEIRAKVIKELKPHSKMLTSLLTSLNEEMEWGGQVEEEVSIDENDFLQNGRLKVALRFKGKGEYHNKQTYEKLGIWYSTRGKNSYSTSFDRCIEGEPEYVVDHTYKLKTGYLPPIVFDTIEEGKEKLSERIKAYVLVYIRDTNS